MKKIIFSFIAVLALGCGFTSCGSDGDDNISYNTSAEEASAVRSTFPCRCHHAGDLTVHRALLYFRRSEQLPARAGVFRLLHHAGSDHSTAAVGGNTVQEAAQQAAHVCTGHEHVSAGTGFDTAVIRVWCLTYEHDDSRNGRSRVRICSGRPEPVV